MERSHSVLLVLWNKTWWSPGVALQRMCLNHLPRLQEVQENVLKLDHSLARVGLNDTSSPSNFLINPLCSSVDRKIESHFTDRDIEAF